MKTRKIFIIFFCIIFFMSFNINLNILALGYKLNCDTDNLECKDNERQKSRYKNSYNSKDDIKTSVVSSDISTYVDINSKNMEQIVDSYVSKYIGKRAAGASIAVLKDGEILLSKGYGYANLSNNTPATNETIYEYASISKLFIWVSAMQLYEEGKLDLNRDIRTYLSLDYPVSIKMGQKVTMLDLMNHTAGFDTSTTGNESNNYNSLGEAIYGYYDCIQCFDEGSIVGYSNYGTNLAAYIVERISGTPFSVYVQEHIFDPLDMNAFYYDHTAVGIEYGVTPEKVSPLKAKCYARDNYLTEGGFKQVSWYGSGWLYASGAANGTTKDLIKFAKELLNDKGMHLFKSSSTLDEMFTPSNTIRESDNIFSNFHGFWGSNGNYNGLGHAGNVNGFTTRFIMNPDDNMAVVVLTNDADGEDLTYGLIDLLMPKTYTQADIDTLPSPDIVAGTYANARGSFHGKINYEKVDIKVSGVNEIIVTSSWGRNDKYKQIQPYLYESTDDIDYKFYTKNKIYFTVKDGKVVKGSKFVSDLIPISDINISYRIKERLNLIESFISDNFKKFL